MNKIVFKSENDCNLPKLLARGFSRVSVYATHKRTPTHITLWVSDQYGIRFHSQMNDISERNEIGSLCFDIVTEDFSGSEFYDSPSFIGGQLLLKKLVLTKEDYEVESGIRIIANNSSDIIILPNSMPCTLALKWDVLNSNYFEPEWDMSEYVEKDCSYE